MFHFRHFCQRGFGDWIKFAVHDQRARAGVVPLVGGLACGVHRTGRRHGATGLEHSEVGDDELRAVGHHQRDAVAFPNAESLQTCGAAVHVIEQAHVRDAHAEINQRRPIGAPFNRLLQHPGESDVRVFHSIANPDPLKLRPDSTAIKGSCLPF